ncbi:TPA: hypothetical protein ACNRI4_005020, partial [Escherichia coli]
GLFCHPPAAKAYTIFTYFVGPTAFYSSSFCPTDATALWFASSRISAPTQAQLTGCNVCTSLDLKRQLSGF